MNTWADVRAHLKGHKIGLRYALTLERCGFPVPASLNWDAAAVAFFWRDGTGHETVIRTEDGGCTFCEPAPEFLTKELRP